MPKFRQPEFDTHTGLSEIAGQMWSAGNGVMIGDDVSRLARAAYAVASIERHDDGSLTRVSAHEGSTNRLLRARRASLGLNAAALGVIHALNGWDDRSREYVTSPRVSSIRSKSAWEGVLQFAGLGHRELTGLAAPFPMEPALLDMPFLGMTAVDALEIRVEQPSYSDRRTMTTLAFSGSDSVTFGVEVDGTVVPGEPFGPGNEMRDLSVDQRLVQASFGSLLNRATEVIVQETLRP